MPLIASPIQPFYRQGYARSAGESAYPEGWNGLRGAWIPAFGPTGLTLRDVSPYQNHGTLTNMDPATDWVISGDPRVPGYALDFSSDSDAHLPLVFPAAMRTQGTILTSFMVPETTFGSGEQLWSMQGTGNNDNEIEAFFIDTLSGGADDLWFRLHNSTTAYGPIKTPTLNAGQWYVHAAAWQTNDMEAYLDGASLGTIGTAVMPAAASDTIYMANRSGLTLPSDVTINVIIFWDYRLPSNLLHLVTIDPLVPFRLRRRRVGAAAAGGDISLATTQATTVTASPTMRIPTLPLSATQAVTVAASPNVNLLVMPKATDAITVTESPTMNLLVMPSVSEFVNATDTSSLSIPTLPITGLDSVVVADAVTVSLVELSSLLLTVIDPVEVDETVVVNLLVMPSVSDSVTLGEATDFFLALFVNATDAVTVTDSPTVFLTGSLISISVADSVTVAANATISQLGISGRRNLLTLFVGR